MFKKLAKYGNSTTLVIDKAILELLNMDESSIVKLQTDGKSLIITPVDVDGKEKKIFYTPHEALVAASNHCKSLAKKQLENPIPVDPKVTQEYAQIMQKYMQALMRFGQFSVTEEFQKALAEATSDIDPTTQSEIYMKEYMKLRTKFFPELAELDKELEAINKQHPSLT